jgi:hypothetical protein
MILVDRMIERVLEGKDPQRIVELAASDIPDAIDPNKYFKVVKVVGPRDFEILVDDLAHYLSSHSPAATYVWVMDSYRLDPSVKRDIENLIKDVQALLKVSRN